MAMLGRGRLFQRPGDSDGEDDYGVPGQLVHAKPINESVARKLEQRMEGGFQGRTFVQASKKSQDEFYGNQAVSEAGPSPSTSGGAASGGVRELSNDEKNKLNARLLKAEMLGKKDLAAKLRAQLESGVEETGPDQSAGAQLKSKSGKKSDKTSSKKRKDDKKRSRRAKSRSRSSSRSRSDSDDSESDRKSLQKDVILTSTDFRTGVTVPLKASKSTKDPLSSSITDMLHDEKITTAEQQLAMFGGISKPEALSQKTDDDFVIDDVCIEKQHNRAKHKRKQRERAEKDEKRRRQQAIKDYEHQQATLDSCRLCVDSRKRNKQLCVASGFKTYLSIGEMEPMVDGHCYIVPMTHASSTVQLDEDVYHEMKIWRKGLVAMFRDRDEDVVFIETAKNLRQQPHMQIECLPIPQEMADTVCIYFKKAILESDEEWASNKKLIDLSKKDIRRSVPKGFSYFAVDFGLQAGYAHVIENEALLPESFGRQIVAGMLDLEHTKWKKPRRLEPKQLDAYLLQMKKAWLPFDWTERARAAAVDDEDDESD